MQILEAQDVDLISPFPLGEIKRMYGWTKAYKSLTETDASPHTWEEFEEYTKRMLPMVSSWGVIDKNHKTNDRHPAPLIGVIIFERPTANNGYFHVATTRRAWGTKLIDQAGERVIEELFTADPYLTRVSALMLQKNHLSQGLVKRLGFRFEGIFRDMVTQNNEPKNIVHFGLTKGEWQCRKQSPSQLELEAPSSEGLANPDSREESTLTPPEL
jgi:RimJ/RimL family protein N-acetyltransferase